MERGIFLEIKDNEIEEIFKEIEEAEETIKRCYHRLRNLGVVTIRKAESNPPEND